MIPQSKILERVMTQSRRLLHLGLDLICPAACAACRRELPENSQVLCTSCWQQLQENFQDQACPVCGHSAGKYSLIDGRCHRCQRRRPVVRRVIRVGNYADTLRELILAFKFRRKSHIDLFLGELLASAILGMPDFADVEVLTPIPLHWRRRWARGYNEAELLARAAVRFLNQQGRTVSYCPDLLRVRNTPPQTTLTPSERLINLRGAFAARPGDSFAGKHVCLIDDVTTTGTTLRFAARALQKAGPAKISAAVLAVAAND